MISVAYALLLSLSAPLLLMPVEMLLPYPYVIEELMKALIVRIIGNQERAIGRTMTVYVFFAAVLFTVSESMFYLLNIFELGDMSLFFTRLVWTGALHTTTYFLLYYTGRKHNGGMLIGLVLSGLLHYWYNGLVGQMR